MATAKFTYEATIFHVFKNDMQTLAVIYSAQIFNNIRMENLGVDDDFFAHLFSLFVCGTIWNWYAFDGDVVVRGTVMILEDLTKRSTAHQLQLSMGMGEHNFRYCYLVLR